MTWQRRLDWRIPDDAEWGGCLKWSAGDWLLEPGAARWFDANVNDMLFVFHEFRRVSPLTVRHDEGEYVLSAVLELVD